MTTPDTERQNEADAVDTRRLLDHLQVGLVMFTRAGHVIDLNRYARLMLGQDEDVAGQLIDEVLPEAIITDLPNLFGRMEKSLNNSSKKTITLPQEDEMVHWEVMVSRSAVESQSDLIVMMLDDVTEVVEYEQLQKRTQHLERMNLAVREANQLKTEFLANMSHELRTPLNSIIGFAELIASGKVGEPSEQHKEFLNDILTSSRHLLQIINDVLDLSKVEAGKVEFNPEKVEVTCLLGEVISILREQAAKKHVRIRESVAGDAQEAEIDPLRTKQILYNFLSNAVKFTKPQDTVTIRAGRRDGRIRFEVEDHGPGIAPEEQHRLFAEFEQLDQGAAKDHQGTGLGLALTKRLAEAQGGSVGVESTRGEGSLFWVEIPEGSSAENVVDEARRREMDRIQPVDASARILVVEDERKERENIVAALSREGYQIDTAATAIEATEKIRKNVYEAITLDLLLPDGHGEDVLKALRTKGQHLGTPVIVASVVEPSGAVLGFPVVDFLLKPFDAEDLVDALKRAGVTPERPILVIDDDPAIQRLVSHHLDAMGYEVNTAGDGEEGLERAHQQPPGLVVLDLLMPGVDGFEFLERFRATPVGAEVPVVVWTTKELSRDERMFLQRAAHKVLQKGEGGTHSLVSALRSAIAPEKTDHALEVSR